MVFNWMEWTKDTKTEKIHPTQKPVPLLERLIEIFTDEGDVVIDPCAGSGSTLIAARNKKRPSYGFEIEKEFYNKAVNLLAGVSQEDIKRKEQGQLDLFDFLKQESDIVFYVISENKILYKDNLNNCVDYIHRLEVKKDTYYWIANSLEYDHPKNTEKRFNSYMTRYNDMYYDFIEQCQNNHESLLKYMDEQLQEEKENLKGQMSIFDFL